MAVADADRLRSLLGESIPEGGDASDTLFTDDQITDLLTRYDSVEDAVGEGWAIKAAALANLVTIVEGSSRRQLSDLHKAAMAQAQLYGWGASAIERPTIGRIVRPTGVRVSTKG